jgi:hypothetical protein
MNNRRRRRNNKPLSPFLNRGVETEEKERPLEYQVVFENVTVQEVIHCNEIDYLTQLSLNVRTKGLRKKRFLALCNLGIAPLITLQAHEKDARRLMKISDALAEALGGTTHESMLARPGTVERLIRFPNGCETREMVLRLLYAMFDVFSEVDIRQVKFCKIPPELLDYMGMDLRKRVWVWDQST